MPNPGWGAAAAGSAVGGASRPARQSSTLSVAARAASTNPWTGVFRGDDPRQQQGREHGLAGGSSHSS